MSTVFADLPDRDDLGGVDALRDLFLHCLNEGLYDQVRESLRPIRPELLREDEFVEVELLLLANSEGHHEELLRRIDALLQTYPPSDRRHALGQLYQARQTRGDGNFAQVIEMVGGYLQSDGLQQLDPRLLARLRMEIVYSSIFLGRNDAGSHLQTAMELYEKVRDEIGIADCRLTSARLDRMGPNWQKAHAALLEAKEIYVRLGQRKKEAAALVDLFSFLVQRGQHDRATETLVELKRLRGRLPLPPMIEMAGTIVQAVLWMRQGKLLDARRELEKAWSTAEARGSSWDRALIRERLGELDLLEGKLGSSSATTAAALREARTGGLRDIIGESLWLLAEVELQWMDLDKDQVHLDNAQGHLDEAMKVFENYDHWEYSVCKRIKGHLLLYRGRFEEAQQALRSAIQFFSRIGEEYESHICHRLLEAAELEKDPPSVRELLTSQWTKRQSARGAPELELQSSYFRRQLV